MVQSLFAYVPVTNFLATVSLVRAQPASIFPCLVKVGVGCASRCPFVAISLIPRTEIYISLSGSFCSPMPKSKASVFPDFLSKVFTDRFCRLHG